MSIVTETASEYFELARKSSERGEVSQAIHYGQRAIDLLLRPSTEAEPTGKLIGERFNFQHLGKVLAAKAEKAISSQIVE